MNLPKLTAPQRAFMLRVDGAAFHMKPADTVGGRIKPMVNRLARLGAIRLEAPRGRFPLRWVVTNYGLWLLGTFKNRERSNERKAA